MKNRKAMAFSITISAMLVLLILTDRIHQSRVNKDQTIALIMEIIKIDGSDVFIPNKLTEKMAKNVYSIEVMKKGRSVEFFRNNSVKPAFFRVSKFNSALKKSDYSIEIKYSNDEDIFFALVSLVAVLILNSMFFLSLNKKTLRRNEPRPNNEDSSKLRESMRQMDEVIKASRQREKEAVKEVHELNTEIIGLKKFMTKALEGIRDDANRIVLVADTMALQAGSIKMNSGQSRFEIDQISKIESLTEIILSYAKKIGSITESHSNSSAGYNNQEEIVSFIEQLLSIATIKFSHKGIGVYLTELDLKTNTMVIDKKEALMALNYVLFSIANGMRSGLVEVKVSSWLENEIASTKGFAEINAVCTGEADFTEISIAIEKNSYPPYMKISKTQLEHEMHIKMIIDFESDDMFGAVQEAKIASLSERSISIAIINNSKKMEEIAKKLKAIGVNFDEYRIISEISRGNKYGFIIAGNLSQNEMNQRRSALHGESIISIEKEDVSSTEGLFRLGIEPVPEEIGVYELIDKIIDTSDSKSGEIDSDLINGIILESGSKSGPSLAGYKILGAYASEIRQDHLTEKLIAEGARVHKAGSIDEAVEKINLHKLDVIIFDFDSMGDFADKLISAYKNSQHNTNCCIIGVTSNPTTINATGLSGDIKVITRPFNMAKLTYVIREYATKSPVLTEIK